MIRWRTSGRLEGGCGSGRKLGWSGGRAAGGIRRAGRIGGSTSLNYNDGGGEISKCLLLIGISYDNI